jgi:hypothetical protein
MESEEARTERGSYVKNRYLKRIRDHALQADRVTRRLRAAYTAQSWHEVNLHITALEALIAKMSNLSLEGQQNLPPEQRSEDI